MVGAASAGELKRFASAGMDLPVAPEIILREATGHPCACKEGGQFGVTSVSR